MFNTGFWISYLSAILNLYIISCISRKLLNIKSINIFRIVISVVCFSFILTINNLYNNNFFKYIITILIIIIMNKLIFKCNLKDSINNTIIPMIIILIIDCIMSIISLLVAKNIYNFNANNYLFKFFYSVVSIYILYLLFNIPKIFIYIKKIDEIIKSKKVLINYLCISFILVYFCLVFYTLNFLDIKYYLIFISFLLITIVTNYLIYTFFYSNRLLKIKNECLENNIRNSKNSLEEYQLLKHNLMNDLNIIKIAPLNKKDSIINEIMKKYNKDSILINDISDMPEGIQGIIYLKLKLLQNENILFYISNKQLDNFIDNSTQVYYDLCEALSICLDNAIEAVRESNSKIIYFNVYYKKHGIYQFDIINTFSNTINIDKLGQKNYSTKNRNSGFGLNYLFSRRTSLKIKFSVIDNLFQTSIIVKEK